MDRSTIQPPVAQRPKAGTILTAVLFTLSARGLLGAVVLGCLAVLFLPSPESWWQSLEWWSAVSFSLLAGLAGGAVSGALTSATRLVAAIEAELRQQIELLLGSADGDLIFPTLAEGQAHYRQWLDRALSAVLREPAVPDFVDRLIRKALQEAIVGRFIASQKQRGRASVSAQDFRNWCLAQSLSVGLQPVYDQLVFWQYVTVGFLLALAAGLVIITLSAF